MLPLPMRTELARRIKKRASDDQQACRMKQTKSMLFTHLRAQVEVDEEGGFPGGDAVLLLCIGFELYCVALVEKRTVWASVMSPCKSNPKF